MLFFIIVTCLVIGLCLWRRAWIMSAPMVVALLYLLWLAPQLFAISSMSFEMERKSDAFIDMSVLCLLALLFGWVLARPGGQRCPLQEQDRCIWHGMIISLILLTIVSAVFAVALETVRVEVEGMSQWSGRATIVNFFAQIRIIPLALSAILFFRQRTKITTLLFAANLIIVLPIALVYMRRAELIDIIVILCGSYWFVHNRLPSILLMLPVGVFAFVMIFIVADLRQNAERMKGVDGQTPSIFSSGVWDRIDLQATLRDRVAQAPDVYNGFQIIDHVSQRQSYTLGSVLWNRTVHQWVPAQIVGADLKASLMFGTLTTVYEEIAATSNFRYVLGTTPTGIGAAFQEFGYLGMIFFLILGTMTGWLFSRARKGDVWDQSLYLVLLPLVMISVTHSHATLFVSGPIYLLFWATFRFLARYHIRIGGHRCALQ